MFQVAGGAIGLGITTTIFTITSENELAEKAGAAGASLTEHQSSVMHGLLAGTETAGAAASSLDPSKLAVVEEIVRDSFVTGIASGFRYVAILAVASFFVSLFFVGGPLRRGHAREVASG
jgi:hypothetical protein